MREDQKRLYQICYLLWFFLGVFGAHRFYLNYKVTGGIFFATFGLLLVGWALDSGILPSLIDEYIANKYGEDVDLQSPQSPSNEIFSENNAVDIELQPVVVEKPCIKHVFAIMLHGRSYDQILGCLAQKNGANQSRLNFGSNGVPYFQRPMQYDYNQEEFEHSLNETLIQMDGNSFIESAQRSDAYKGTEFYADRWDQVMGYFPLHSLPVTHTLAENFRVCDKWFSSVPGDSLSNIFFALTGTSRGAVGHSLPTELGKYQQSQQSIFDRLNAAGKSWKIYHEGVATSLLLPSQWEQNGPKNYKPITEFKQDCENKNIPDFTLIEPKYGGDGNDDGSVHSLANGQNLLANVYNSVKCNEELWNSSLIVVFYSQHGGFYDHMNPPVATAPDHLNHDYAFDSLGVRVPAMLISPLLEKGFDSRVYDHTCLLSYICSLYNLSPLSERAALMTPFAKDVLQTPRTDVPSFIEVPDRDTTIRSGHDALPFTKFQKDVYNQFRNLARHKACLKEILNQNYKTWSEFENMFMKVLNGMQK
ncbi:hypothetical protein AKO1_014514 [Acrasis kona]|uniref:TM2 domain-containing protein n=1 Tax=Acrasis kona TaxID=1008807 RepID=A0AAW2Z3J7_9EUKA